LKRYGQAAAAAELLNATVDAAQAFPEHRLPELFTGFERRRHPKPVPYPVACSPQAWAAGAVPFMLQVLLGWEPDATTKTLVVSHPVLPAGSREITVRGLRVGQATVSLRYRARDRGAAEVEVLERRGELAVHVRA
jgi:glycogen debranching enzyme